jgi:hypothetical protein
MYLKAHTSCSPLKIQAKYKQQQEAKSKTPSRWKFISFQVAVPFKKPSTRKTKTRGSKSKTSEKEFTKPDARLMNSPTIPNDQNRAQSV